MEERKRPASYDHEDGSPPLKKQATAVNGSNRGHPDTDMPWKDDLERFQKEAILRQLQEAKRERNSLETRLNELIKRSIYHDDHLRIIDAWFSQLLDEVKIIVGKLDFKSYVPSFTSALFSADKSSFEAHLKSRTADILSAIEQLFSHTVSSPSDVAEFQEKIAFLLSVEKEHVIELEKGRAEKEQLEERLESASLRYMVAEKKLDRAKSATVAKLERQALSGGGNDSGSGLGGGHDGYGNSKKETADGANGVDESRERHNDLEVSRKEAVAATVRQKEQLAQLESENEKLTGQLTALNIKLSRISDDECSRTDIFKNLKSQHEDVIKRINNLEATNLQLREEAEKLQAERTAYRMQMETETQAISGEKEAVLVKAESDLSRVRSARDELLADLAMRKAAQDQNRSSVAQVKELAAAREERIETLESEIERLRIQLGQANCKPAASPNLEALSVEDLRTRHQNLESQHSMLSDELPSIVSAWKKASAIASQKIADLSILEEKVIRSAAEKSKADQKYFASRRSLEAREAEVRTLRAQNSKSSDVVSQLKDAEAATRALVVNLEKQLSEIKESLKIMTNQYRSTQQQLTERNTSVEGLKTQVEELSKALASKDSTTAASSSTHRKAEVEIEQLNVRLEETKKNLEVWKSKGLGNQTAEHEQLRHLAYCTVCKSRLKDTAIKTCGHIFCKECVDERLTSRSRKCPNCNRSFGTNDTMHVTM